MRIKYAVRFANGNVAVFDEHEAQVPTLQGTYAKVREAVLAAADEQTIFQHATHREGIITWPRETW